MGKRDSRRATAKLGPTNHWPGIALLRLCTCIYEYQRNHLRTGINVHLHTSCQRLWLADGRNNCNQQRQSAATRLAQPPFSPACHGAPLFHHWQPRRTLAFRRIRISSGLIFRPQHRRNFTLLWFLTWPTVRESRWADVLLPRWYSKSEQARWRHPPLI